MAPSAKVLVVDDEEELADLFGACLSDEYEVTTSYSGEEALQTIEDDVDVLLLDRQMPVVSGPEVLDAIERRDVDCRVALVTANRPDFDILDLDCDDYLVKPVERDDLRATVERLVEMDDYADRRRELTAMRRKRSVLKDSKPSFELENSEQYQRLTREITSLADQVADAAPDGGAVADDD